MVRTIATALLLPTFLWADESTFFKHDDGRLMPPWVRAKTGEGEGSAWTVVADATTPSKSGYALAQTAEGPNGLFNLCVHTGSKFKDGEVSVMVKAIDGKLDQGGGVVWRYKDADNYYLCRFNPLEDNLRVYHVKEGKRTQLATMEELKIPAGAWFTVSIKHTGKAIACSLNGTVHLEVTDDTFPDPGRVGVWSKADAQSHFDKFQFDPVPPNDEAKAALAFLRTCQHSSGGFPVLQPPKGEEAKPSLRATRTAIRAFQLWGGEVPNRPKVEKFLADCFDEKTGGFADRPGAAPDPISTSVALMIHIELKMPYAKYLERALKFMGETTKDFEQIRMVAPGLEATGRTVPQSAEWLKTIAAVRNEDGSYGTGPGRARTTALNVAALQRLVGSLTDVPAVVKVLDAGRRPDGGFGNETDGPSDLESCYRIVRLYARLDAKLDKPDDLRGFILKCRNDDGGFSVQPGKPSSLHGTYYAAIVRYWLDGGK